LSDVALTKITDLIGMYRLSPLTCWYNKGKLLASITLFLFHELY
jgi:hypothetical protein